jgi:hypothetical protein
MMVVFLNHVIKFALEIESSICPKTAFHNSSWVIGEKVIHNEI